MSLFSPAKPHSQSQHAVPLRHNRANAVAPIDPYDDAKLLLHHDNMTNECLDVTCMDISPQGGLLVTGCDDGVVRLWRYGGISTANLVGSRKEVTKSEEDFDIMRKGGMSEREVRTLRCTDQHQICRLQGHVAKVTGNDSS